MMRPGQYSGDYYSGKYVSQESDISYYYPSGTKKTLINYEPTNKDDEDQPSRPSERLKPLTPIEEKPAPPITVIPPPAPVEVYGHPYRENATPELDPSEVEKTLQMKALEKHHAAMTREFFLVISFLLICFVASMYIVFFR